MCHRVEAGERDREGAMGEGVEKAVTVSDLYKNLCQGGKDNGWGSHFSHIYIYIIVLNAKNPGRDIQGGPPSV